MLGRRILLCGQSADVGQTKYFAPALLHVVDHLPVYSLAIPNLYSSANRTPEEFIAEVSLFDFLLVLLLILDFFQTLTMASRCGPCVVYVPAIDAWDSVVSPTAWVTFKTCLDNWTAKTPILVLVTAHCSEANLDSEVRVIS